MSIATAIQNAQQKVANAYTAVNAKGGTLPATQDLSNLPTAIESISTGDEITATNTTGSAVSADDRVWVNGEDVYTQNFTIVGSPTIVNKVVSNFSTSNYLQVSPMVNTTSGTWTFDVEFTYVTSGASTPQPIVFFEDSGYDNFAIFILNDHINANIPSNISAGYEMLYSPSTLTSGETYHLQLELTANSSKIYIKNNGSIIETLSAESGTYMPTSIIGFTLGGEGSGNYYFSGSINLNNTNIKINNSTAWSPYTKTGTNYSIINDTDITSTSFTGIAQEAIANNATGSVKTLLDGNGTYAPTTATKSITTNGTYTASAENAYGLSSVTVEVPGMDTVEAYNDTGSAISTGDKVWINKGDVYSYNFNVIGSPIINKDTKIASGFGADSFLTKTGFSSANPWEINLKVKFSNVSTGQNYFSMIDNGFSVVSGQWQFALSSTSGKFDIASGLSVGSVSANTWYWVRFIYSGTDYKFYVSTDGETYSLLQTFNSSAQMKTNGTLWFGNYAGSSTNPNPATYTSIDLSETYMDIGGQSWWTAITKVWDNNYKLDSFLEQNTPNVTKMGSVTFTDNYIGSDFGSSNYLKSNTTISEIGTADSWEFVTRICMTSAQSSNGMIISQNTGSYGESGFMFFVGGSNRFAFQVFDQSLNLIAAIDSSISLENNQWYWLKGEFTGTAYNCYISTDKETWTNVGTAASTTKVHTPTSPWRFGSSVVNSGFYLYGKMDFMETYLKINGEVAWNAIGYGMSGNITEDTLTGTSAENIAIGDTGDVEIGNVIEPTLGTKTITVNGTYNASTDDLDGFSSVTVDVLGIPREVSAQGVYQVPTSSFIFSLPSNATDVGDYALYYAFYYCKGLTSIDLSSLTTVSGNRGLACAFYGCTGLTSIDLSSLATVSGSSAFYNAFQGCTGLTSVDLFSLTTVSGNGGFSGAFRDCTGLTDIYFRALTTTSFGSYTNQFSSMLAGTGTTKTHTLHFPSNLQSTISGLQGYPNFGGTAGYVTCLFDLPATS